MKIHPSTHRLLTGLTGFDALFFHLLFCLLQEAAPPPPLGKWALLQAPMKDVVTGLMQDLRQSLH